MSELNIKQEKYDRYIDSTVDLFMECYDDVLTEEIRKEVAALEKQEVAFPGSLDERCLTLIKKECARHRRKQSLKAVAKGLRYAAVIAVALLSLSSLLFMTVEAIRIPIINFFVERSDGHWKITGEEEETQNNGVESIDLTNPLAGLIPEEYELIALSGDLSNELIVVYASKLGGEIFLSMGPSDSSVQLDMEDAELSYECEIGGCEAVLAEENDTVRLVWIHKDASMLITISSNTLTDTDIVLLAEELSKRITG